MTALAQGLFDSQVAPMSIISWGYFAPHHKTLVEPSYSILWSVWPLLSGWSCVLQLRFAPKLRLPLAKTFAYSLKIFLTSCWSLGSHSVHSKGVTVFSKLHSEVGSPGSNCGDIGVSLINALSGEFEHVDQPTHDGSFSSFEGRTSHVWSRAFILGTLSAACTLPIMVLGGILTSWADKFHNICLPI